MVFKTENQKKKKKPCECFSWSSVTAGLLQGIYSLDFQDLLSKIKDLLWITQSLFIGEFYTLLVYISYEFIEDGGAGSRYICLLIFITEKCVRYHSQWCKYYFHYSNVYSIFYTSIRVLLQEFFIVFLRVLETLHQSDYRIPMVFKIKKQYQKNDREQLIKISTFTAQMPQRPSCPSPLLLAKYVLHIQACVAFPLLLWQTVGHCMFYLPHLARPVILWHIGFVKVALT